MKNNHYLKRVMTGKEMSEVDRFTIEQIGIPGRVLMESAGRKVVAVILQALGNPVGRNVVIVCGKGNNGGDGYVIARYLHNAEAQVQVFTTAEPGDIKGDAAANLIVLDKVGVSTQLCKSDDFSPALAGADLIVDALLGTGVTGALQEKIAKIVRKINDSPALVVAVDLPTGLETDTGAVTGECVRAAHTVTIGNLKRGLLFSPGREYAGQVHVADIGFPELALEKSGSTCYRVTHRYVESMLPGRSPDTFKNRCGKVLVVAGSPGMTGAAALTAEATLKIGAGLTILGIPASLNPILEQKLTEVMTLPLPETSAQTFSFAAKNQLIAQLAWADVLALGPGMTTDKECGQLLQWLLQTFDGTIVLDADGLNCLANNSAAIVKAKGKLVLTPHPGELAGMSKCTIKEILANPVEAAKVAAKRLNATVVLKGAPTVTAKPIENVFINPTGNAGMATAGMGDVLTGVIAGLAAQGLAPAEAAIAGVYLHGLAGDFARAVVGESGLVASDVLQRLPLARKEFEMKGRNEVEFD